MLGCPRQTIKIAARLSQEIISPPGNICSVIVAWGFDDVKVFETTLPPTPPIPFSLKTGSEILLIDMSLEMLSYPHFIHTLSTLYPQVETETTLNKGEKGAQC
jgi:hypothetical protein